MGVFWDGSLGENIAWEKDRSNIQLNVLPPPPDLDCLALLTPEVKSSSTGTAGKSFVLI